ncbi:MAG: (Fe-S)-binding protein [Candidatus Methanofastidiosa archaeon]|nr:(Fe-S)-binding protein [Candidatus Methanofastidiosa archaeon]
MSSYLDQVNKCTDCGECGLICPICHVSDKGIYSPDNKIRQLGKIERNEELTKDELDTVYLCSRCGACNYVCPEDIDINGIIQYERSLIAKQKREPEKTSHIANNIITRFNPKGMDVPNMASMWVAEDLKFSEDSKLAYMAGCWVALKNVEIAQDTVRILNACGIRPKTLEKERCCGLFVIDNGHFDEIRRYAKEYTDYIESQGVEVLLVSCPACYDVMKNVYPELYRKPKYRVVSALEMFKDLYDQGKIKFDRTKGKVSMRDACPMKDVFSIPRELIGAMGYEIIEPFDGKIFCCGAPAGVKPNYPEISNAIGRITFEKSKDAEMIVSYCSFCKHHLDTISEADGSGLPVIDLSSVIWKNMRK